MAIWTKFLLAGGVTEDQGVVVEPEAFNEIFTPEIHNIRTPHFSPPADPFLFTTGDTYTKGFTTGWYRGMVLMLCQ